MSVMTWAQTEAETWEALANAIDRGGVIDPCCRSERWGTRRPWGGLCATLVALQDFAGMPDGQWGTMDHRVWFHGPMPNPEGYRWPLTPKGDRARAAFCRRMAKIARREATGGAA